MKGKKGEQLQMFMRPGEILEATGGKSVDYGQMPGVMKNKLETDVLDRAKRTGTADGGHSLATSVSQFGVREPIILTRGNDHSAALSMGRSNSPSDDMVMGNGHHRLAAALDAEKRTGKQQYIPVVHDLDYMGTPETRDRFGVSKD